MLKIPRLVSMMVGSGALIVGGIARAYAEGDEEYLENAKDWDVMVTELDNWYDIALLIPKDATVNSFGGWKFKDNGVEVDVWPESLEHYLAHGRVDPEATVYAYDFVKNRMYTS
jgi:hypothetical protein